MRYRVAFAGGIEPNGQEPAINPTQELDPLIDDGVIAEKVFVERLEAPAQHAQTSLDEDDSFLGSALPEIWEYEVVDDRAVEFEEALRRLDTVLEYEVLETNGTGAEEVVDETASHPDTE